MFSCICSAEIPASHPFIDVRNSFTKEHVFVSTFFLGFSPLYMKVYLYDSLYHTCIASSVETRFSAPEHFLFAEMSLPTAFTITVTSSKAPESFGQSGATDSGQKSKLTTSLSTAASAGAGDIPTSEEPAKADTENPAGASVPLGQAVVSPTNCWEWVMHEYDKCPFPETTSATPAHAGATATAVDSTVRPVNAAPDGSHVDSAVAAVAVAALVRAALYRRQ
jgi:hypothetical protein